MQDVEERLTLSVAIHGRSLAADLVCRSGRASKMRTRRPQRGQTEPTEMVRDL